MKKQKTKIPTVDLTLVQIHSIEKAKDVIHDSSLDYKLKLELQRFLNSIRSELELAKRDAVCHTARCGAYEALCNKLIDGLFKDEPTT